MKRKVTYLLIILLLSGMGYSQGKEPPRPKTGENPPEYPIDGGITFLLIIGTAFGVYKLKKK